MPIMASLGQGGIVGAITTAEVAGGHGFLTEAGLDGLLTGGVLGGNVYELPHHAWGLMAKHMDECLIGHAIDEGIDHVSVSDVGELIALLGEALNVLPEGLVSPLLAVAEVP